VEQRVGLSQTPDNHVDKGAFMTIRNTVLALWLALVIGAGAQADTIALNPNHPDRYTVLKGDTLWDISARFLQDPWTWPDVWQLNPQIENPNLIYPNDVISLELHNGKPVLKVERGSDHPRQANPVAEMAPTPESATAGGEVTVKLSPQVRISPLDLPIPTVPTDAIEQFLVKAQIVSPEESEKSAYVLSMEDERLVGGTGNTIYARKLPQVPGGRFEVVRMGKVYRNSSADGGAILGYEALHIADAQVETYGDPSTLTIVKASREVLTGDRLLPAQGEGTINYYFLPKAPEKPIEGKIIALFGAVARVAQFQVVALNLGLNQGLRAGDVLAIYSGGDIVRDNIGGKGKKVTLPDIRAGVLMVFRVFDKVSYGLIMSATQTIHLYDMVRNP
jgi:hypothetical protein